MRVEWENYEALLEKLEKLSSQIWSSGVKTSAGLTTRHPTIQRGCQIDLYSRVIWIQKFHICFSSHFIAWIRAVLGGQFGLHSGWEEDLWKG